MVVVVGGNFIDTDDYDIIQSVFEDYLYGEHIGEDENKTEYGDFYLYNYLYVEMKDVDKFKRKCMRNKNNN